MADHVAVSTQVDAALGGYPGARPRDPPFDDVVADGLIALEVAGAPVVDAEVDVTDVVVANYDVEAVLSVDAPVAVLDGQVLDDDVRDRDVVLTEGDDAVTGVPTVHHRRAVARARKDNRL